jgi:hypothetical protein
MNTEVRDHNVYLKGALDLITGGTTADTGTATRLDIIAATTSSVAFQAKVGASDPNYRIVIYANGDIGWGDGSAAQDTFLARSAAGILSTSQTIRVGTSLDLNPSGYMKLIEITAPGAAPADGVYFYAEDNGSGKTRIMAKFNTGAAQQVVIQP